jgi:putative ABC transport system ATP-binding protein
MSQTSGPLLRTENLSKNYPDGSIAALVDVSLSIARGEYVAIMGPSGSGKSTLLNLLGGLDRPSAGEVYFDGTALSAMADLDAFRARRVGFVFQSFHLLPVLTAVENVQIPMFETDRPLRERAERAAALLQMVQMSQRANHLPKQLSVGERQRVAIARALANDPVLLLADEPTGNLDSQTADEILRLFEQLHEQMGMTIVLITHDNELGRRAPRLIRMRDGHLVSDETQRAL